MAGARAAEEDPMHMHSIVQLCLCMGKLHGASRAPWKTPTAASACVDALALAPRPPRREELAEERGPTFSDGGRGARSQGMHARGAVARRTSCSACMCGGARYIYLQYM